MANPIFTTETVAKSGLYQKIKDIMIAAGWTSVSSNTATDYDVLTSTGEDGTKSLVFQMRDFHEIGTSGANSITTVAAQVLISIRAIYSYVPGAPGNAGTFGRSGTAWFSLWTASSTAYAATGVDLNTQYTLTYHCNKNRLIIILETPIALNLKPQAWYLGLPDDTYCSEPVSKGVIFVSTLLGGSPTAGNIWAMDHPSEYMSQTDKLLYNVTAVVSPKNPNSAGKYHLSDMFYSHSAIGLRGRLSGIYALPITGLVNGDQITVGAETYKAFICYGTDVLLNTYGRNSFPTTCLAVRIS